MCSGCDGWTRALSPRHRFGVRCCLLKLRLDCFTRIDVLLHVFKLISYGFLQCFVVFCMQCMYALYSVFRSSILPWLKLCDSASIGLKLSISAFVLCFRHVRFGRASLTSHCYMPLFNTCSSSFSLSIYD